MSCRYTLASWFLGLHLERLGPSSQRFLTAVLRARGSGEALICNRVLCFPVAIPHAWHDIALCSFSEFVFPVTDASPFIPSFFYGGISLDLILSLWSPDPTMTMHSTHALQHAVPTLYGRDQSPGVPWGIDGHGAVLYRVRVCPRVLGWILHTGRYVDSFCLMRYRRVVRLRRPPPFRLTQFSHPNTRLDMMTLHGDR